jgi:hypothetical protein
MPNFPSSVGASAAAVWAYAARTITALTGQPRTDLVGADNALWANASRTLTAFTGTPRTDLVGADNAVWANASRELTALTGTPRTDLLGEDADFEAGTGARLARIDNTPAFVPVVEASYLMDGSEDTLIEVTDTKPGEIEVWVDLTPMGAGNIIIFRYARKMKAAGAYVKYAEETYSGAQSIPALCVLKKMIYRDTKVTAEQTDAGYITLDVQVIRTLTA